MQAEWRALTPRLAPYRKCILVCTCRNCLHPQPPSHHPAATVFVALSLLHSPGEAPPLLSLPPSFAALPNSPQASISEKASWARSTRSRRWLCPSPPSSLHSSNRAAAQASFGRLVASLSSLWSQQRLPRPALPSRCAARTAACIHPPPTPPRSLQFRGGQAHKLRAADGALSQAGGLQKKLAEVE